MVALTTLKPNNFSIHSFMTDMGLKGNRLLIYALIYSFCCGTAEGFYGSEKYIADCIGATAKTSYTALRTLAKDGLIIKAHNGKRTVYKAVNPNKSKNENNTVDDNSKCVTANADKQEDDKALSLELTRDEISDLKMLERMNKLSHHPKYRVEAYGKEGVVAMTDIQYSRLLTLVSEQTLKGYLLRFEKMLFDNIHSGIYPHSPYRTIKKWIENDFSL